MTTTPDAPAAERGPGDAELITAVRAGDLAAYGTLYERHRGSANNLARQLARSPSEADDLVSEAFAKLLDTLRGGGGPDSAFRAYLLTALRHTAYDRTRRERRVELSGDVAAYDAGVPFTDTAVAGLDRSLAARAFSTLPERWQTVLWHTEIEQQSAAEVAPLLGLTPNGVSALAYRAREGLRQAYLQVHLADPGAVGELERCRATVERLGAWVRTGLSRRETAQIELHLDECERCRALAVELADVNGGLRVYVAPLVLGAATDDYLATTAPPPPTRPPGGVPAAVSALARSVPHGLLAVGTSAAVLAAVVVVGLVAVPGSTSDPSRAAAPPSAVTAPTPPPVVPVAPPLGDPAATEPVGPPDAVAPTTAPPLPTSDAGAPPVAPEPPPAPGSPAPVSLAVSTPGGPVQLVAGGEPAVLRLAITNTGGTTSGSVVAALSLPPGVTATAARVNGIARAAAFTCLGANAVRCATTTGIAPGATLTMPIAVVAGPTAIGGVVDGTVSAGQDAAVDLGPVLVDVARRDRVDLAVDAPPGLATMRIRTTNNGPSAGTATVTVQLPALIQAGAPDCSGATVVTCAAVLAPGETREWTLALSGPPGTTGDAVVTATLGAATRWTTASLRIA